MTDARSPVAVIVMGVSGSGKSTVGALLAGRIHADFIDADDLHSAGSKAKMAAGIALTDADRAPWLRRVADITRERRSEGQSAVVACSALRRTYRDALRAHAGEVEFVHLTGTRDLLVDRLRARAGHFMSPQLLDSQLNTLEPLGADENGIAVDIAGTPQDAVARILKRARAEWTQGDA